MELSIRTVVIAVTVLATASIALFMVTGEASSFMDIFSGYSQTAECELAVEQGDCEAFEENDCGDLEQFEDEDPC